MHVLLRGFAIGDGANASADWHAADKRATMKADRFMVSAFVKGGGIVGQ